MESPLKNFQTLNNQGSLLAGLHTLSKLFHYKTQKQPNLRHLGLSALCFNFQVNFAEVSLTHIYVCIYDTYGRLRRFGKAEDNSHLVRKG